MAAEKEASESAGGGRARERWYGLDWIRFICVFYVVFGHTYKVRTHALCATRRACRAPPCADRSTPYTVLSMQISQYEEGGWRDKDEKYEPGLYIFRAVSLGYHWYAHVHTRTRTRTRTRRT
jgi:hypothetical protein